LTLKCPFDGLPCMRNGDCGDYCRKCQTFDKGCSRFNKEQFDNDPVLKQGFRIG